jgi:hypothetical protein
MPFLLRATWPVAVMLKTDFNICASEQLSYKHLAQRLLLSRDGTFHILSELLDRCFDGSRRLLTIAAHGESLPDEVIREAHNRQISCPPIIISGDKLREIKRRMSETSQRSSDMFVLFVDTFEHVQILLGNVKSLPLWNPRGRFMVVIAHPLLNDREAIIQNIFQRMLSEKILEVVVVFRFFSSEHCSEDTNSCSLLTSDIQVAAYNTFRHSKGVNYITGVWPKVKDVKALFPSLSDVIGYPLGLQCSLVL